jgi:hypothetical protein
MAILVISHLMKSITYKHQIYGFRVFRQSLRISKGDLNYRYRKNRNFLNRSIFADLLELVQIGIYFLVKVKTDVIPADSTGVLITILLLFSLLVAGFYLCKR